MSAIGMPSTPNVLHPNPFKSPMRAVISNSKPKEIDDYFIREQEIDGVMCAEFTNSPYNFSLPISRQQFLELVEVGGQKGVDSGEFSIEYLHWRQSKQDKLFISGSLMETLALRQQQEEQLAQLGLQNQ